jgi:tRNA (mo5U34)-methyltransferase
MQQNSNLKSLCAQLKMSTTHEAALSREQIQARIKDLGPWFHNMELRGVPTAPEHFLGDYPRVKFKSFADALPARLDGMRVLDIGCNAGFYSMEMKRRGAERVVGIDSDERFLAQARFAAEVEGYEIEFRNLTVYDVAQVGERFDLVIFMGVLYHLRHPLLALDLIHEHVASDLLLFQSMQRGSESSEAVESDYHFWRTDIFENPAFPCMFFIEQRYSGDPTNWWIPNMACVEGMLRSSGFDIVSHPEKEVFLCRRRELSEWEKKDRAVYPSRPMLL